MVVPCLEFTGLRLEADGPHTPVTIISNQALAKLQADPVQAQKKATHGSPFLEGCINARW